MRNSKSIGSITSGSSCTAKTVRLPTADVIRPNTVGLALDRYIIRKPDDRPDTNLVQITRGGSVLEDEIGRSVRLGWKDRVYETFFQPKTL